MATISYTAGQARLVAACNGAKQSIGWRSVQLFAKFI